MSPKSDLEEKRGLGHRHKLILVSVTLLNLCLYGAVFLMSQGNPSEASTSRLTVDQPLALQEAHRQALAQALSWQTDVELAGVTTSWQLASGDRLTLHRPGWSFNFYSPTARQVQIVTVDQQGAQAGPRRPVDVAPLRAGLDWQIDSEDLLLTFLSYGGQTFIDAHPQANVHMHLKAEEAGHSIWYVTAVDPTARQSLTVGIDAFSRQVVVNETDKGDG